MRVKICGITNLEDALISIEAGADAIGFVFYKKSERYIAPKDVKEIVDRLPPFIERVGVFVEESPEEIDEICRFCNLSLAQLHNEKLNPKSLKTKAIRVVRVKEKEDLYRFKDEIRLVDAFVESYGGEGKRIRLDWFNDIDCTKIIIAGGLNCSNIWELGMLPFFGVDVSSGVEEYRGKKNKELIKLFVKLAKAL